MTEERRKPPKSPGGKGGGRIRILREGDYDGTFFGTTLWPELLIGAREIARFFRISQKTCWRWLAQGRLPATKDAKGRWIVTRRTLEHWMLKGGLAKGRYREDRTGAGRMAEQEMERDERKEMGLSTTPSHCLPPHGPQVLLRIDPSASGKTPEAPSVKLPEPEGRWWER